MIPHRCNCGVHYSNRCPDRNTPGHYRDDRMAPIWAYVFLLVGCVLAAGGWYVWQVIS